MHHEKTFGSTVNLIGSEFISRDFKLMNKHEFSDIACPLERVQCADSKSVYDMCTLDIYSKKRKMGFFMKTAMMGFY